MLAQPFSEATRLKTTPPVLAAGGLVTGSHVAAMLTLGAAGVALGTRFLLTPEALYSDSQKAALLKATAASTIRTTAFDALRGTIGWPEGIDGRALRNETIKRLEEGSTIEEVRPEFEKATREGDASGMLVWSGTGVGLMHQIKPAAVRSGCSPISILLISLRRTWFRKFTKKLYHVCALRVPSSLSGGVTNNTVEVNEKCVLSCHFWFASLAFELRPIAPTNSASQRVSSSSARTATA